MVFRTIVLLVAVCGLAVVTIRLAAKLGYGKAGKATGPPRLTFLEEIAVGPRQSIIAVRAADRVLLATRTPAGITPLSEIPLEVWESTSELAPQRPADRDDRVSARARSFAEVLEGRPGDLTGAPASAHDTAPGAREVPA